MKAWGLFRWMASLLVCQLAGALGSLFTAPAIPGWYAGLVNPSFSPPNWVFAPVWTALFLLMGVALALVWQRKGHPEAPAALRWFAIQWMLNVLWSIAFFGLHSPLLGLVDIVALWVAIVVTILRFRRISRPAAWLLAPYIAWVSFALILNAAQWWLNR